jgi:arsenate reductase
MSANLPRILFLCARNDCRSQIAEAWARKLARGGVDCWSAGLSAGGVDPRAVTVMREVGLDLSEHRSKQVSELPSLPFDWVFTLADIAAVSGPVFPVPARLRHHAFPDPVEAVRTLKDESEILTHYRRSRDEILAFIKTLPGMTSGR